MRTGAEVKVGLITLVAIGLLAVFLIYVRGSLFSASTYRLYVSFDNAQGLQRGDPVRMVGVKIGEVRAVEITPTRTAQVTLAIGRQYPLFSSYRFQIATAGLIQERFIEVIPTSPLEEGVQLKEEAKVEGIAAPGLADLLAAAQDLLTNLNRTSDQIRTVLTDEEIMAGIKKGLDGFALTAESAAELAGSAASVAEEVKPLTVSILTQLKEAASDVERTTSAYRAWLEDPATLEDTQEIVRHVQESSRNLEGLTASLARMVSDPGTQAELRATLSDMRDAAASLKAIGSDVEVFSAQLRKAAPAVPEVVREAEEIAGTSAALRKRLEPPEIHGNFSVVYSGKADRSFSSGSLDISTSSDRFLRFGIDDIGEENSANIQLGERQDLGVLRYGLVRSRLGLGFDLRLLNRATLSLDLFDPNRLRGDLLADVPLILGGSDLSLIAGVRDMGQENYYVLGAQLKR